MDKNFFIVIIVKQDVPIGIKNAHDLDFQDSWCSVLGDEDEELEEMEDAECENDEEED